MKNYRTLFKHKQLNIVIYMCVKIYVLKYCKLIIGTLILKRGGTVNRLSIYYDN
jgi:hypothetical protein